MIRVSPSELAPSQRLARPIRDPRALDRVLLERDVELSSPLIHKLRELELDEIWIRCEATSFLENLVDAERDGQRLRLMIQYRDALQKLKQQGEQSLDIRALTQSCSEWWKLLRERPYAPGEQAFVLGERLAEQQDPIATLASHSVNVSQLTMQLALHLEQYLIQERTFATAAEARDGTSIGLGALLHDIGKLQLSAHILEKKSRLSAAEVTEYKRHPELGYALLKGRIPATAAQLVLHHHQRWDGDGYPANWGSGDDLGNDSSGGKRYHVNARIAAVAEHFESGCRRIPYAPTRLPIHVLAEIRSDEGAFDPTIAKALFGILPPFPIGSRVTLDDDSTAAVIEHNPSDPCRPIVQRLTKPDGTSYAAGTSDSRLDLALEPSLSITRTFGMDVKPFLFEPLAPQ